MVEVLVNSMAPTGRQALPKVKSARGLAATVICLEKTKLWHPVEFSTFSVTVNVPAALYVWFCETLVVAITSAVPSPKFQIHLTMVPLMVEEESETVMDLLTQAGMETPNLATGGIESTT